MDESDQFYQELPYTLQEEHLDAEYLILGTGLQESALAAYLAKMEAKKVLIFDQEKTYGSTLKTITLKQLVQLTQKLSHQRLYDFYVSPKYQAKNQQFYQECLQTKAFRGYNIDIEPSAFFANSITCESLKQADMDKYMEFRLVHHLLMCQKDKFEEVPLSKGKIFESKTLSLMEKKSLLTSLHTLIKLYQKHTNIEEDQNSTKQFDKGFGQVSEELFKYFNENLEENFRGLLEKITKKNKKIMDFIAYIVCNYQHNYSNPLPEYVRESFKVKRFIERFGKFINSCGIYGESPYLYVDNGMGDIPQAFSRIASIFGSTFILHPKLSIDSIEQGEEGVVVRSNIAPGRELRVRQLFYGETFEKLYKENKKGVNVEEEEVLRVLLLCRKLGNEKECPSIGYLMGLEGFNNPVTLFMFDESTHSCPSGYVLYQFSTILDKKQSNELKEKREELINLWSERLISKLQQIAGKGFDESIVFSSSYIRRNNVEVEQKGESYGREKQVLLKGFGGLDLDGHFENFIRIVGKKDNYFRKKNPYQEEYEDDSDEDIKNTILERLDNIQINKNKQVGEQQGGEYEGKKQKEEGSKEEQKEKVDGDKQETKQDSNMDKEQVVDVNKDGENVGAVVGKQKVLQKSETNTEIEVSIHKTISQSNKQHQQQQAQKQQHQAQKYHLHTQQPHTTSETCPKTSSQTQLKPQ